MSVTPAIFDLPWEGPIELNHEELRAMIRSNCEDDVVIWAFLGHSFDGEEDLLDLGGEIVNRRQKAALRLIAIFKTSRK
jgi:hypothetical protein